MRVHPNVVVHQMNTTLWTSIAQNNTASSTGADTEKSKGILSKENVREGVFEAM